METNEKDLIENSSSLCNWMPGKGDPYTYSGCGMKSKKEYSIGSIGIKITDTELEGKEIDTFKLSNNLKRLEGFEFEQTKEIASLNKNGQLSLFFNETKLNTERPIDVVLSYPFEKMVLVTIQPTFTKTIWEDGGDPSITNAKHIGHLAWQIAKAYGIIYRTMDNEVGIWGHGFSDLYLERITILEGNKIVVGIGS